MISNQALADRLLGAERSNFGSLETDVRRGGHGVKYVRLGATPEGPRLIVTVGMNAPLAISGRMADAYQQADAMNALGPPNRERCRMDDRYLPGVYSQSFIHGTMYELTDGRVFCVAGDIRSAHQLDRMGVPTSNREVFVDDPAAPWRRRYPNWAPGEYQFFAKGHSHGHISRVRNERDLRWFSD